jgi:hypothetical protein
MAGWRVEGKVYDRQAAQKRTETWYDAVGTRKSVRALMRGVNARRPSVDSVFWYLLSICNGLRLGFFASENDAAAT